MLLFSKFILHPEKMEVPNVKKKKKNYIKLARYNMQMTERGFFFYFSLYLFNNSSTYRMKLHRMNKKK